MDSDWRDRLLGNTSRLSLLIVKASYAQLCKELKINEHYLDKITHKRNCQIRDAVNKAARFIINYCLTSSIGNIVFGWGQGVKKRANLGRVNNQNYLGAINILKKVAIQLNISLAEVGKEALTIPKRYTLDNLKKIYRKRCEALRVPA